MQCPACKIPIGSLVNINVNNHTCVICNSELPYAHSTVVGTHKGKSIALNGYIAHQFSVDPYTCPGCGLRCDGVSYDCWGDGEMAEIGYAVELPQEANNACDNRN